MTAERNAARPLYELAAGFNNIFDLVLDDTMNLDTLEEGLSSIECELEEKCANGIALIKSPETYAEAYAKEERRFGTQRQILENRVRRIKGWYRMNLDAMGKTKVLTRYGVMSVQGETSHWLVSGGKRPLAIDDEGKISETYLVTVPAHKEVNRDALYAALDKGEEIPGVHLEPRGRGLRIR